MILGRRQEPEYSSNEIAGTIACSDCPGFLLSSTFNRCSYQWLRSSGADLKSSCKTPALNLAEASEKPKACAMGRSPKATQSGVTDESPADQWDAGRCRSSGRATAHVGR